MTPANDRDRRWTAALYHHAMVSWNDVVAMAQGLPSTEVSTWYRTPGLKVAGKGFARLRTESDGGLVLMCSAEEKERLLESGEPAYYTTPHYDGYGAILVDLTRIDPSAVRELLVQSWRLKAPRSLRAEYDAAHSVGSRADAPDRPRPRSRQRRPKSVSRGSD